MSDWLMNLRLIILNYPLRASTRLPRAVQRRFRAPQAGKVEGGNGQRQLDRHFCQAPPTEPPHSALLFQDPDHRFHDRLAPLVDGTPGRVAQLLSHPTMD